MHHYLLLVFYVSKHCGDGCVPSFCTRHTMLKQPHMLMHASSVERSGQAHLPVCIVEALMDQFSSPDDGSPGRLSFSSLSKSSSSVTPELPPANLDTLTSLDEADVHRRIFERFRRKLPCSAVGKSLVICVNDQDQQVWADPCCTPTRSGVTTLWFCVGPRTRVSVPSTQLKLHVFAGI